MMYLTGESRVLVSNEREYQDKSWTEHSLKVELENGSDIYLKLSKKLATDENIEFLNSLKGQQIEVQFWISHRDKYLTYFMSELPKIK
ncbi:hypothetical protein KIN38_17210 [Vibrio sp. B511a]|uniref:hypothetical protein n=1 Tax=Vibrio TaxID=662 RepID=UPI0024AFA520|nr:MULTISPECIES: hypothetical protein [Vibrio]EJC6854969.1 hypothetical protein [Vibrio parahaemolyticus]MDI7854635.1 hypothetical protein [Vibrio parahaemolyticus]MDK9734468.1 hypothetical protein [Vibrio sp. B511a]